MPVDPMIARGIAPLGAGYANTMMDLEGLRMEQQRANAFDQRNALLDQRQQMEFDAESDEDDEMDRMWDQGLALLGSGDPNKAKAGADLLDRIHPGAGQTAYSRRYPEAKAPGALYKGNDGTYKTAAEAAGQPFYVEPREPRQPPQPRQPTEFEIYQRDPAAYAAFKKAGAASNPQAGPQTESDRKATLLFGSIYGAERDISKLEGGTDTSSRGNAVLGAIPLDADLAKGYQSQDYKKYESAAKRWSANLLYMKSGATATPEEVHSTYMQFFPQPGDEQAVKDQKKAARLDEMQSIASTFPWLVEKYDLGALYPAKKPAGKNPQVDALLNPKEGQRGKSKSNKPMIFRNGRWEYE